ncbi:MAG: hypothetical protein U5L08_06375 [Xanthomonadales bacterium]|nr:hypothetical protein [Xanthomonadales bacterium]
MTSEPVTKIGMQPVHPGRFVRMEILEDLGLSVARAAGKTLGADGRPSPASRQREGQPVAWKWRSRLEKAFGVSMDTLLRLQAWHDAERMRAHADEVAVTPYVQVDAARRSRARALLCRHQRMQEWHRAG